MKNRKDTNRNPFGCKGIHRLSNTKEYSTWVEMRRRCQANPTGRKNEKYYINKNISICQRWDIFLNFLEDMGNKPSSKHTIDRIDSNGNYEPSNCRWATLSEQNMNRKTAVKITWNNQTHCIAEWARILNIKEITLYARIQRYKWSTEKALTTLPSRNHIKKRNSSNGQYISGNFYSQNEDIKQSNL